jgi:hypothetical protein
MLADEPVTHRVLAVDVVEGAGLRAAEVDDGNLVEVRTGVDRAAAVRPLVRDRVSCRARCRVVEVEVVATHVRVERDSTGQRPARSGQRPRWR